MRGGGGRVYDMDVVTGYRRSRRSWGEIGAEFRCCRVV